MSSVMPIEDRKRHQNTSGNTDGNDTREEETGYQAA
jgi:hypothetical protein